MGVPKLSLELAPGNRLGAVALMEMLANPQLEGVSVVVRHSDSLHWIPLSEEGGPHQRKLRVVPCRQASQGMSYSLREGLKDALSLDPQAIIVVLADQPFITSELLDSLIAAYLKQPDLDYVACAKHRLAMPPVLFAASMFDALGRLEGDSGARKLLASEAYRGALISVASPFVFTDVDTPFELKEARRYWQSTLPFLRA